MSATAQMETTMATETVTKVRTVKDLKAALAGIPDDVVVTVVVENLKQGYKGRIHGSRVDYDENLTYMTIDTREFDDDEVAG